MWTLLVYAPLTSLALREEEVRPPGREKVNKHVTPIQTGSFQFLRRRVEHPNEHVC